jgi:K+-transporting ATPase ATPase C chain
MDENKQAQPKPKIIGPAIRIVVLMLILVGVGYPLVLVAIGQTLLPVQSNGSLVKLQGVNGNGTGNANEIVVGSSLIGQEFQSAKFFHSRHFADSSSGLDPHITPEYASAQVENVSRATGIPQNYLRTLIELNVQTNRADNLSAFAPPYVNVLELNLELVRQYPNVYQQFLGERR